MELLSIILTDPSKDHAPALMERLKAELSRLRKENCATELSCQQFERFSEITIAGKLPSFQLRESGDLVYRKVGGVLADFILDHEESKVIRRIIVNEFHFKDPQDIGKIEGYCQQFLFSAGHAKIPDKDARRSRKQKISRQLVAFLRENERIHLEGFVAFRLHDYLDELREVVEYAMDEYQMDQQYQEFISLLKYFVYIQEAKIPVAHLIHRGGNEFSIFNDQLKPISTDDIDASFTLEVMDRNTNFEDVIVSTLITVSPQQIYIHTKEPELQMIQTIMQIFENRVVLCHGCRLCKSLMAARHKHDQLSP